MNASTQQPLTSSIQVALWVTCLADWMRPRVASATVDILTAFGCHVTVPIAQTCCGQPAYNSGEVKSARAVALQAINTMQDCNYIVLPSGSCTGMIVHHYPKMFQDDEKTLLKLQALQGKVFELTQFLVHVLAVDDKTRYPSWPSSLIKTAHPSPTMTYHDSCSGLRELNIKQEPRRLIRRMQEERSKQGVIETLIPLVGEEDCCGFGGSFSAKYGEISSAIAARKCDHITATKASTVILGDLGCMLNIEGKLRYQGSVTRVIHIAEYLAGH